MICPSKNPHLLIIRADLLRQEKSTLRWHTTSVSCHLSLAFDPQPSTENLKADATMVCAPLDTVVYNVSRPRSLPCPATQLLPHYPTHRNFSLPPAYCWYSSAIPNFRSSMLSIPSEPYGSGVATVDVFPHVDLVPPRAPLEESRLPNLSNPTLLQPPPQLSSRPSSPAPSLPYVDLPRTYCASDITCHSPTITTSKPAATENTVRVTPISDHPNHLALRMGIVFCDPSQLFSLQGPDGREARMTMGEVLRRYCTRIASIDVDATAIPNPRDPATMTYAVSLPFSPDALASEAETLRDRFFPILSALEDLSITTSRAPSICTLLHFLQHTPLLKNLAITNRGDHQAVLPDDVAKVAAPTLPRLHRVSIDGLLTNTVEQFLDRLLPSITPRTILDVHFHTPTFPAFNHDAVMAALFAPAKHVNLAYLALSSHDPRDPRPKATSCADKPEAPFPSVGNNYLFSLSDAAGRATLTWHWAEEPGARPSLGHIGLTTRALACVRTVSLALYNVHPSLADLHQVLQSFSALARLEVHATHLGQEPVARHGTFRLRAAPLVQRVADVPTLFARGLTRWVSAFPPIPGTGLQMAGDPRADADEPRGRQGLLSRFEGMWYRPLWAVMVRKPLST